MQFCNRGVWSGRCAILQWCAVDILPEFGATNIDGGSTRLKVAEEFTYDREGRPWCQGHGQGRCSGGDIRFITDFLLLISGYSWCKLSVSYFLVSSCVVSCCLLSSSLVVCCRMLFSVVFLLPDIQRTFSQDLDFPWNFFFPSTTGYKMLGFFGDNIHEKRVTRAN